MASSAKQELELALKSAFSANSGDFGLELLDVDVRGVYPTEFNLRDKLRAMDPPLPAEDMAGHGLSADYWADVLTPPMFEKYRYGSNKEVKTPATVSLEWVIPSPPDFHHFNMVGFLVNSLASPMHCC